MAKYKIGIQVIETYNKYLIVDAESEEEAREKVENVWEADADEGCGLYSSTTDCLDNQDVNFFEHGEASESDINMFENLNEYEDD